MQTGTLESIKVSFYLQFKGVSISLDLTSSENLH